MGNDGKAAVEQQERNQMQLRETYRKQSMHKGGEMGKEILTLDTEGEARGTERKQRKRSHVEKRNCKKKNE